jgi:hypothetical protein
MDTNSWKTKKATSPSPQEYSDGPLEKMMEKPQFSWRKGPGEVLRRDMHYCEAVQIGDILHLSGTGMQNHLLNYLLV